jgi:hypothetical protein
MIPMMISSPPVSRMLSLFAATVLLRVYPRVNTIRTFPRRDCDVGDAVQIGIFLRYPPKYLTLDLSVSGAAFWTFRLVFGHQQARQRGPRRI